MSDALRESTTDKIGSAVKPDSQKTYLEQATDYVKGTLDSVASAVQPQEEKSTSQKAVDAVTPDNSNKKVA